MFDAAGAATGADAAQDAVAEAEAANQGASDGAVGDDAAAIADAIEGHVPSDGRKEVVIVDPSVASYQDLLSGMDPNVEIIILNEGATVSDVASALDGRNGIDAVHLISHGGVGSLNLGGETLSLDTLEANADALRTIGAALSVDGDLLLYGCNVGADGGGEAFLTALASATGADVAASSDATGAAALGGDWVLEAAVGDIESGIAVSAEGQAAFSSVLATMDFSSGVTDNGNTVDVLVSGVTATFSHSGVNIDVANGGGLAGSSGEVVFSNASNTNPFTVSFSSAVDITSLHLGRLSGQNSEVTISVTDGSGNTSVVVSGANYSSGSVVSLNWTGVTSFTIDHTDAGHAISPLVDNIIFSAANAAPSLGGTPADVTVTEDVATAIDLSAYNVSDSDGDTITLTLAVSAGTIASVDGNGTTSGVTVASSGSGSMTLQGTAANLNTYLNDTSKIRYTTASNSTASATLTVTPNDGTTDGTADTVTINVTSVNDNPGATGVPASVTVTEDTLSNVDLSAITFSDVDSASITVTLTASAGTFATPADGAGVGGGVTETLVSATTITLVGSPADISTYLDSPSSIQYTPASNVSGNAAATITVTANDGDGSGNVALGTVNVNVTAVNDNPTIAGLPASVTVTEDTQGNVDLSAATFADIDSASITVTLTASAGTFATPADGAGVGGGVTETLVNATTITLVGAPADISTYLDTASNIQYTPASNVSGNAAATITVTANDGDGSGNVALGTVNVNVTAVNDNPTGSVPATVTVTEDTLSNVDLSAASFADVDGDTITVTLTASAGTFATPADGAGVGGGVTETLVNATTITLVGAAADINTYLDTASNIRYTSASNASGNSAATITVTVNDGQGSGNVSAGTVQVNVTAVNDAPAFSGLDGTPAFTEGGSAVVLDSNVTLTDVELVALNGGNGNFAGASLVIVRNGGANAADAFSIVTGGNLSVAGSDISSGGNVIASFDTSSAGQVTITFQNNGTIPTTALVNEVMQAVRYSNTANDPAASVQLNWTFSDGNSGNSQGTGDNPGTASGSTTVSITNVNDAPTLTATGSNPTFTEDGGAQDLFNTVTGSTIEAADRISAMTMTVTNVSDGASEILAFDGTDVALTNGNSVVTATNGLTVNVSVTGSTATVSFTGATLSSAQFQTLVDSLTYRNASDNPTTSGNRVVTITGITDNGGTANGGSNSAAPNVQSTVSLTAVNDAPVIGNLAGDSTALQVGNVANIDNGGNVTVTNADSTNYNGGSLIISDTNANNTANGNFSVDGTNVTSGGDTTISAGETILVGGVNIGTVHATNDGQSGRTLQIDFNVNATNERVQALIQNLRWGAAAGSGAQTFTATLNDADGTANGGDQDTTANFTMTVGNLPAIANLNGDSVTFTEGGGAAVIDSGGDATVTDADNPANFGGGNLTVTVSANAVAAEDILTLNTAGTVALAGTTAGSNVSVGGTVIGTLANSIAAGNNLVVNLNSFATLARVQTLVQAIAYNNASDAPTTTTRTVSVTLTDNDGLTSATSSTSVSISAVNDAPVFTGLDGTPTVNEQTAVVLDSNATVADAELDALNGGAGNYSGATLTLSRNGGANAEDAFSNSGTLGALTQGGNLTVGGTTIGTVTTNSGGTLLLTFNSSATRALVNSAIQQITYTNTSDTPPANAQINYVFNDGNSGSQGSGGAGSDSDNSVTVTITPVNDAPTATGIPASVTVTEDVLSNIDLSAVSFADLDGNNLTVTLTASAGTFATPADGAAVGAGVTETLVNATTITLAGSAADIATYLDTATNIRYTTAANAAGNNVATISVAANDGTVNPTLGTIQVNSTAVNDAPSATGGPAAVTVTEDTLSNVDLSAITFSDVDGDSLTVTLTASAGTFATPADGAGVGAGVTETLVNATTMTLVGSAADISTYLDTATNIRYTTASNAAGNAVATITITASDGTVTPTIGTVNVNSTAVNDAPQIVGANNTVVFNPSGGTPVVLDGDMTVTDPELAAAGDFDGLSVTIVRSGGADANDLFNVKSSANVTKVGNNLQAGGNTIATLNTTTAGQLVITFDSGNGTTATAALVNEVVQNVTYATNAVAPTSPVTINITANDGALAGTTQTLTASLAPPPPADDFVPPPAPTPPPGPPPTAQLPLTPPPQPPADTPVRDAGNGGLNPNGPAQNDGRVGSAVTGGLGARSAIENTGTPVRVSVMGAGNGLVQNSGAGQPAGGTGGAVGSFSSAGGSGNVGGGAAGGLGSGGLGSNGLGGNGLGGGTEGGGFGSGINGLQDETDSNAPPSNSPGEGEGSGEQADAGPDDRDAASETRIAQSREAAQSDEGVPVGALVEPGFLGELLQAAGKGQTLDEIVTALDEYLPPAA